MPKQVLGKSIGNLLETDKSVSKPLLQTAKTLEPEKLSSQGLKVLVAGAESAKTQNGNLLQNNQKSPDTNGVPHSVKRYKKSLIILFAADLFLIIMAFTLILGKSTAPSAYEWSIAIASIIIGAILGCWAILERSANL